MRFSSGKQWECPCSRRVLILAIFSTIFQGCTASEKNRKQCQKLEQRIRKKEKRDRTKRSAWLSESAAVRMMGESWPIVVFKDQEPKTRGLDLDLNEIFGTALGEFIASNQQARNTEQLMTLQWKTKREIMSFPFVPVSPSINRNMQHTQSESAKSIPVLL